MQERALNFQSQATFFIAGYWGFGNVGDEAVLAVTLADIRALHPRARIIVTSERPKVTESTHGVEAVGWRSIADYLPGIQSADHVIVGGGGLWNSYFQVPRATLLLDTSNYAEHIYTVPIIARLLDKPVTIYCVGGGVIAGDWMRELASLGLACASTVLVRDQRTLAFFSDDLKAEGPILAADPAFRLEAATDKEMLVIRDMSAWVERERPIIAVVRHWMDTPAVELAENLGHLLADVARQLERPLLFLPFDRAIHEGDTLSDDAELIAEIRSRLPAEICAETLNDEVHPSTIYRLMLHASAVISMRLHGCIFAAAAAKPLLALEYDPKVRAVLSDIGLSECVTSLSRMGERIHAEALVKAAKGADGHAAAGVAEYARSLSATAPRALALAVSSAHLPPMPSAVAALQPRLTALSLQTQSIVKQNIATLAAIARDAVNCGDAMRARGILAILRLNDPECGEWYYLEAIAHSAAGGAPGHTFEMLDKAYALGFDSIWVRYVRACTLAGLGRLDEARSERDAARAVADDHPAFLDFEAAF